MRKRILLVIGLTIAGMLFIITAATRLIILDSFTDLQDSFMEKDVARLVSAIDDDLEGMNGTVGDWAEWDETYQFAVNTDEGYIKRNLSPGVLENLRMNFIIIQNGAGAVVYAKAVDLSQGVEIPVPKDLLSFLDRHTELRSLGEGESGKKGIVLVASGPLLLCSGQILDSYSKGPAHGFLYMGRFLDSAYLARISRRIKLEAAIAPLASADTPADFKEAARNITLQKPVVTLPLALNTAAGYTVIRDILGSPALLARITVPRNIDREGYKTILYFIVSISVIGVVFGAVVLLFLEKTLVSRVHALSAAVLTVGTGNNPSLRVPMSGTDELAYLGAAINGMLTTLEQSSADLRKSEARHEALLAAIPDMIARLAEDGTILDFRWPETFPVAALPRDLIGTNIAGIPFAYPQIPPELIDRVLAAITESSATGAPRTFEFTFDNDGTELIGEARVAAGTEKEIVFIVRDVTLEKKAKDAQKNEILLKEIHHRVKNNLQVISSLLDLQARHAGDERTAALLRESQDRLRSMSLIHEKLYRAGKATGVSIAEYINDLAVHLRRSFSASTELIEMDVQADDISLDMDIAVPCGLIVTELISNSLKYAFPEGRKGRIRVGLGIDGSTVVLRVWDDGVGLPEGLDFKTTGTLGLRIVNILVAQLAGSIEREEGRGTCFVVRFPYATPAR
jgi:two-component sensor histidine kinase/sensor domain CHASE-containing protein